jgi:hypothetical protein
LIYFLVLHYNFFIIIEKDYLPVQKKKQNKTKKTCCNSLPPAATGAPKATRWSSSTKIGVCVCVCVFLAGGPAIAPASFSSLSLRFASSLNCTQRQKRAKEDKRKEKVASAFQAIVIQQHAQQCSECDPANIFLTSKFNFFFSFFRDPLKSSEHPQEWSVCTWPCKNLFLTSTFSSLFSSYAIPPKKLWNCENCCQWVGWVTPVYDGGY